MKQNDAAPAPLVAWPVRVFSIREGRPVSTPGYEVKAASFDGAIRAVRKRYDQTDWLIRSIALVASETGGAKQVSARSLLKARSAADRTLVVYLEKEQR